MSPEDGCIPVWIAGVYFYKEPKKRGKFMVVDSGSDLTTALIVERIINHR